MTRLLRGRPITVRITATFCLAMAVLLLLTGAFIYERMSFALLRSIRDVPATERVEIDARERHHREALHELLIQLALAFGGALVISAGIGHRVARSALRPVEEMRGRAAAAPEDASARLPVADTDDELSRLAVTLNDLLERVERGVAREHQLVADASHELRTPLGLLRMQVDLALSRQRTPEETRVALERMRGETQRLIALADDLLLLARLQEPGGIAAGEPVDVRSVLSAAAARVEDAGGTAVAVHAPADLAVRADADRLAQVLDDLLDNARRHGAPPYELRAAAEDGAVRVHVLDRGPGFPEAFLPRAFDRFATAAPGRTAGSSGLGLAIVRAVVAAADGEAGAVNRAGGGADVWLTLPRT